MNVLVVIPSFYPAVVYGGPIFSTYCTYKSIRKPDVKISVSTTNANGNTRLRKKNLSEKITRNLSVKYYHDTIIGRFSFSLLFGLIRDVRSSDIVHAQSIFSSPTPIALFYAYIFDKPLIISPRGALGGWCLEQSGIAKAVWLKVLINPFIRDAIWHVTSDKEGNDVKSLYPDADVVVISNGVDLSEAVDVNHMSRDAFYLEYAKVGVTSKYVVSTLSRIHEVKGMGILIRSVKLLIDLGYDVSLFIAGRDDGDKSNLISMADSLKISSHVFFTGELLGKRKYDFLAHSDVFVLPSYNENFGNVYLESLAAGTPIVASTNTPWSDVEHYMCGKWVDNSVRETTEAIKEILDSDFIAMGKKGQEYAQRFDWKNIASMFENLYRETLNAS